MHLDTLASECGYRYKNKRIRKILSKNTRVKIKNINNVIVFELKRSHNKKEKIKQEKKVLCSICYESDKNLKYINCKRKGVQNINFEKYSECCKDKAICQNCIEKCFKSCPFCKGHKLTTYAKNRFPEKKPPPVIRQERLRLKKLKKERKESRKKRAQRALTLNLA